MNVQTLSIIFGLWAAVTSGLSLWLKHRSNIYQKQALDLKSTLEQLKLFDEPTAKTFLVHARAYRS